VGQRLQLDPADTRAPIARAALALAQNDHTSGTLRLAENSELISLDKAIATALRLRGVERPGAAVANMPIMTASATRAWRLRQATSWRPTVGG